MRSAKLNQTYYMFSSLTCSTKILTYEERNRKQKEPEEKYR
jgi:hypothetical protein